GHLALRTYAIASESFKCELPNLGVDPRHVAAYRLTRLPRHVWIVEFVDRRLREAEKPCVLGEAVVDSTSSDLDPDVIAWRLHGAVVTQSTNRQQRGPVLGDASPTSPG